jgi:mRNA-degrading endonuclease RelE of RelBE toxin-antitoxin system
MLDNKLFAKFKHTLRAGDYRIGLKWDEEEKILYFVTFNHRKDIYKAFL